jgi:peptidase E
MPLVKDKHVVAFGGDMLQADPRSKHSAKFLIELTGKAKPKVCFLATASGDAQEYIAAFYARYSHDLCEASHLSLFTRTVKDLRSFLLEHDIIYVGGGNTANMFAVWRVHGVEAILKEAYQQGTVMCGTSAGSLCWFECGVTDSFSPDLDPINDGLGIIKGSNCPHYNSEANRQPQYHKFLLNGLAPGYAADDGAALHFANGNFKEAVSSIEDARAFRVELKDGKVVETQLAVRYLGK